MGGNPVFEFFAKLSLDDKEFEEKTKDAKGKFTNLASFLDKTGKVMAGAFTATAGATVALGKKALDAYSNYEQLAGGIQKLFGEENADIVMNYAEKAFLTSGKSVNSYMNSVSQISASLKRSIGDDMQEVARVADIAMQIISDNVNTFGSDAEFVENAIMGLSRNNYTMIDNLKLGYAGSAEGMVQLINDSGVLGYKLRSSADLAKVGFDEMILAIKAVQEQNGIAGTTAKEALTTIEGAGKATAAAWENVVTAIGKGEGVQEAMKGLSDTIFGVGLIDGKESGLINQIIPRIQTIMEQIGDFVVDTAPMIAEKMPEVLNAIVPSVLKTVVSLFTMLGQFMYEQIPVLFNAGIIALNGFLDGLQEKIPDIISWAIELIGNIASWIIQNLPTMINTGMKIVGTLIQGLVAELPHIVSTAWDLAKQAFEAFFKVDWFSLGRDIITGIIKGLERYGDQIRDSLKNIAKNAFQGIKNFFGIESPSKLMRDEIGKYIPLGIAEGIKENEKSVFDAMSDMPDVVSSGYNSGKYSYEESPKEGNLGTVIALLQKIADEGLNVTLEGDANQIFKVVRKQSANFERAKGYSAI